MTTVGSVTAVAVLVTLAGPVADRLPSPGDAAAVAVDAPDADVLRRVGRRYQPPPPAVSAPTCLRAPGEACFLWTHTDIDLRSGVVAVAGGRVLISDPADQRLTALEVDTGRVAWTAPLDRSSVVSTMTTTAEVVLVGGRQGLTAIDLDDGSIRWVNPELTGVEHHGTRQVGDRLVLSIAPPPRGTETTETPVITLVGLDATDGKVRWEVPSDGTASTAIDGTSVLLDGTGALVALDLDGAERWRVPEVVDPDSGGGAWVSGQHVHVWSNDGAGDQLHRLSDGGRLDVAGHALVSDERHTLLEVWPASQGVDGGDAPSEPAQLILLDAAGEVWRVEGAPGSCTAAARLEPAYVRVTSCDGARTTYDRTDGTELRHEPAVGGADDVVGLITEEVGPYRLVPEDVGRTDGAWLFVDRRSGEEVIRMPADAHPLSADGPDGWSTDLGGVAVVQHAGGLTAIDLPRVYLRDLFRDSRGRAGAVATASRS